MHNLYTKTNSSIRKYDGTDESTRKKQGRLSMAKSSIKSNSKCDDNNVKHEPLPETLENTTGSKIEQFLMSRTVKIVLNVLLCVDVLLVVISTLIDNAMLRKQLQDNGNYFCKLNYTETGSKANWSHGTYAGTFPNNAGSCVDGAFQDFGSLSSGLFVISILELIILSCFIVEHMLIFIVLKMEYFNCTY